MTVASDRGCLPDPDRPMPVSVATTAVAGRPPLVEVIGLTKLYPGVAAIDHVDFDLKPGEVHVLFGENGAGKSTLISILAGANVPTAGRVLVDGEAVHFRSVRDARARGISAVFQEFSLVPTLSVAQNIFLGDEITVGPFLDKARMLRAAEALLAELEFAIPAAAPVSALSRAEQQMVEIAKAFRGRLSVLILDEPTASLSDRETERLFATILNLKARGIGIIYISHRIHEFDRIADRITVLRDGKLCATVAGRGTSEARLVELMTGRSIAEIYPSIAEKPEAAILDVEGLVAAGVDGVSLTVRPGQVLGCAGLVGSGKSRLWRAILGLHAKSAGRVVFKGRDITRAPTRTVIAAGLFYLPPDRKAEGLQLSAPAASNLVAGPIGSDELYGRFGLLSRSRARARVATIATEVGLDQDHLGRITSQLSGGNQQKLLFGKGFGRAFDLYVLDEPTVGVDMGTRAALYQLVKRLTESGKAVVIISSDLPEVMNLSHRLLVFSRGRIAAELTGADIEEANILGHFFAGGQVSA